MYNNKEIGSYFELELNTSGIYHTNAIELNLGRCALEYIIRAYDIKHLWVPYYTCNTVWEAVKKENCSLSFYEVDKQFKPILDFPREDYIIYTNYFGINSHNVKILTKKYKNLIIDNTMAFFPKSQGLASFNSCRKFFGVSDGAYLYCDKKLDENFEIDISWERFIPCLKRVELGANSGYSQVIENENKNILEPIKKMSKLTKYILESLDYESIKSKRIANAKIIHENLKYCNELTFEINEDNIPMRYPLLIKNDKIKNHCLENNIYLASYWSIDDCIVPQKSTARYFQKYIFPIPIDQRYNSKDMEKIIRCIKEVI